MYRAFRTSAITFENTAADKAIYEAHASEIRSILGAASKEGRLDGTKIRDSWFPQQIDAQVFISHSHKDVKTALQLSNWLRTQLGIKSFIDSAVWLYADDLLRELDDQYCYKESSQTYSYEKRNGTTAHVHMMLATALSLMLDSCECAFFIDSLNSVSRNDAIETTGSPWIMYELNLMGIIRPKRPSRLTSFSDKVLKEHEIRANAAVDIDYDIDLSHLALLSGNNLNLWCGKCSGLSATEALDALYRMY